MRRSVFKLLIYSMFMLAICSASCSDDEPLNPDSDSDQDQVLPEHHDERLVGNWRFVKSLGDDDTDYKTMINLNEDGTGSDNSASLKWSTTNAKLEIVFADGSKLHTGYKTYGAILRLEDYAAYEMELPFLGSWTAANAGNAFSGTDFFYQFNRNGEGGVFTFGTDGIWKYQESKWSRAKGGFDWMKGKDKEHLSYQVTEGRLTLEGKGEFVQTPPYYGEWKSVSSSAGAIQSDDYTFSSVKIYLYHEKTHFYCEFREQSNLDGKYYKSNYQTVTEVAFSKQQQMIILLPNGTQNATALHFRFYYSKEAKKVFMDLSKNIDFKEYVRYEYQSEK